MSLLMPRRLWLGRVGIRTSSSGWSDTKSGYISIDCKGGISTEGEIYPLKRATVPLSTVSLLAMIWQVDDCNLHVTGLICLRIC